MYNYSIFAIENGFTIARLMYDHAITLNAIIPYDYKEYIEFYINEQKEYYNILLEYLNISNNNISKEYLESDIVVTKYTYLLERKTSALSRIYINEAFTEKCLELLPGNVTNLSLEAKNSIRKISNILLTLLKKSLKNYTNLKKLLADKKIEIFFNHQLIDHFISETENFIYTMEFFENELQFTPTFVYCMKYNINHFAESHVEFIKEMIEPTNPIYNTYAYESAQNIKKIIMTLNNNINPSSIEELNKKTIEATKEFINWTSELVSSLVHTNYYSTTVALLYDHILREANYTYYLLMRL